MGKLLSIVVPTKNRYPFLFKLIELVDSFATDEIELVITDNNDDNTPILEYFKEHGQGNYIIYKHQAGQVSMSENSDRAILNSSGEYVCFIGDDDGVTPYVVDCAKWMKKNNIEIVVPEGISYHWPDFITSIESEKASLKYEPFTGEFKSIDCKEVLKEIMDRGFVDRGRLPLAYHGIAKRETLNKIYDVCNTFYPGPSPDIANGVALSLVADKYYLVSLPLVIAGASATHGGGIRTKKNHAADIDEIPFMPKGTKQKWEKNIPLIWTGSTIWCESAIKALRAMHREDLIEKVNFEYFYVYTMAYYPAAKKMAYALSSNKFMTLIKYVGLYCTRVFNYGIRVLKGKLGAQTTNNTEEYHDVFDIVESNKIVISDYPHSFIEKYLGS